MVSQTFTISFHIQQHFLLFSGALCFSLHGCCMPCSVLHTSYLLCQGRSFLHGPKALSSHQMRPPTCCFILSPTDCKSITFPFQPLQFCEGLQGTSKDHVVQPPRQSRLPRRGCTAALLCFSGKLQTMGRNALKEHKWEMMEQKKSRACRTNLYYWMKSTLISFGHSLLRFCYSYYRIF